MNSKFKDILLTARGYYLAFGAMSKTQYFSRDEILCYQVNSLRKIFISAYNHIPYYQKLFWDFDFDPSRFKDLEDLQALPVLTKKEVLAAPHNFFSAVNIPRSIELHTSGTTGNPLTAFTSPEQWIVEQAAIWRHWNWAGYHFRDRMVVFRSYSPKADQPIYKLDHLRNWLYVSPYHLDESNVLSILKRLQIWRPKFLRGYPSSLYLVAKIAINHGIQIPSLVGALTASEVLTDEYREVIESAFNIKVFDHYGQAEISAMAHECESHNGLHLLDDYAYTELLEGEHSGERRLIATNLFNETMPLIRYDTGDKVVPSKEPCKCGRVFQKISRVIGRADQLLVHGTGHFIPSINFYTYFAKRPDILRFQIIQSSSNKIEVRLQLSEDAQNDAVEESVRQELEMRFGCIVDIIVGEDFIMSEEGKCNAIIQKIV